MPNISADDLCDAADVAAILGLSSPRSVSVYHNRYADFPTPFVQKASGKCVLWLRADIVSWASGRA